LCFLFREWLRTWIQLTARISSCTLRKVDLPVNSIISVQISALIFAITVIAFLSLFAINMHHEARILPTLPSNARWSHILALVGDSVHLSTLIMRGLNKSDSVNIQNWQEIKFRRLEHIQRVFLVVDIPVLD